MRAPPPARHRRTPPARRDRTARARPVLLIAAALSAAGCGSARDFPPAAEPARAPPLARAPAGRVLELPGEAEGVAVEPRTRTVAVGLRRPARLLLLDADTLRRRATVRLPAPPRHLSVDGARRRVLAPLEKADTLATVQLPGGAVRIVPVGRHPHDAAAAADRIFVGDELGDDVAVVERGRVTRRLDAPVQPGGIAVVDGRVGLVAVGERVLRLYDARSPRGLGTVAAGVGPTHVVAGPGARLYVADTQGDAILDFATRPRLALRDRTTLPGVPYGIAADPGRRRLWVTLTARNQLVGLRLRGGRPHVAERFPTVRQPNTVAADLRTGRAFVAGRHPGRLQVIDPDGGPDGRR